MSDPARHAREDALIRRAERVGRWLRVVPWDLIGIALAVFLWAASIWNWTH